MIGVWVKSMQYGGCVMGSEDFDGGTEEGCHCGYSIVLCEYVAVGKGCRFETGESINENIMSEVVCT